jgi:uncharacterized tellurite resistance protein B-like protein
MDYMRDSPRNGSLMFDRLKTFLNDLTGETPPRVFEADDYRLAAVALMVHIASVDGEFDAAERERLQEIVEYRFGLDGDATRRLIETAWESERDSVDLDRFTSVLKRTLDDEGRLQVVGMLWDLAYADGEVHEFEENVVWRVAEMIGVSARDRVTLRQHAKNAVDAAEAAAARKPQ